MALKKITYNGSSKVIKRLCEVVNDILDNGSSGHTIIDKDGNTMPSEAGLQFTGATVTDDSVNGKTVVAVPTNVSDFTNDAGYLTSSVVGTAAAKDYTSSVTQNSGDLVTSGAVWSAIDNLPEPMIFKGTLGTGGTISALPAASSANEGFTYKVIEDGTYDSKAAKVGDVFTSNGSEWVLIPSGDETYSDTWRGIQVNGTDLLGNGINTGAVNFKSGTNAQVSGSGNDVTVDVSTTFTEASTRANIASGESFATILGKIKKWFSDLASMFVSKTGDTMSGNLIVDVQNGTVSTDGTSDIVVGNNIPSGTNKNSRGRIQLFGILSFKTILRAYDSTADRTINFPDSDGTVALTSDIPDINSKVSKSGDTMSGNLTIDRQDGTSSSTGSSVLELGNNIPVGTNKNSRGALRLWGRTAYYCQLVSNDPTQNYSAYLPNKNGTLVVEADLATPINNGTSIALSDFMSIASGITISDSDIRILNNHVSVLLVAAGGVTIGANGTFGLGTIKSAYRPSRRAECATIINKSTSGQVYVPATVDIDYTNGYTRVICQDHDVTYGNATYPWSTTVGFWFDYWL